MYGKLTDNQLEYASKRIIVDDKQIFNPTTEQLCAMGYKHIVFGERPLEVEGYFPKELYIETDNEIHIYYQLTQIEEDL